MSAWVPKRLRGLAYVEAGAGPVMVLCHGGAGSHTHWTRNIDALAQRFNVRAVDLPGFGESERVPRGMELDDYIALARESIDAVGGEQPFHLVGFSFGAVLSAAIASGLSERISRLTLCGAGGFGPSDRPPLDIRRYPPGTLADPAVREAVRHNLMEMMLADPAGLDEATLALQLANARRTGFDSRRLSLSPRLPEDVSRVAGPVQAIWGAKDQLAWPSVRARAQALQAARPDVRVDLVDGAGHWVQFERPEAVNSLILEFHHS